MRVHLRCVGFFLFLLRTWYWVSESDICAVAVAAGMDIEAKTFEAADDAVDAEGTAEDEDPMPAFTGCRWEFRFPTSWNDMLG